MKRIEDLFILHVYIVSSRLLDFVYLRVKLSTPWVIKLSYFNLPILGGMIYRLAETTTTNGMTILSGTRQ